MLSFGKKSSKLYFDMAQNVYIQEEIELKHSLGLIYRFIGSMKWNLYAPLSVKLNMRIYYKLLIFVLYLLHLIWMVGRKEEQNM